MPQFATASSRWAAVQARDPAATSAFIYSVTTTKIYCRPTCPSRLARRANVVFHDNSSNAEADGFRPCKRCHPQMIENDGDPQRVAVDKACKFLVEEANSKAKMSVKALAVRVGLTECHFCRVFKKIMGVTVGEYRRQLESTQHPQVEKENNVEVDEALRLSMSLASAMNREEFIFDLAWDGFAEANDASDTLFGSDLLPGQQLISTADLTINNNIFDFVDFGESSC